MYHPKHARTPRMVFNQFFDRDYSDKFIENLRIMAYGTMAIAFFTIITMIRFSF